MLLSPRARRLAVDVDVGSGAEHDSIHNRQRCHIQIPSPRLLVREHSSTGVSRCSHTAPSFPRVSPPPPSASWRRHCLPSIVPVLATACLCTVLFCLLHIHLTSRIESSYTPTVLPILSRLQPQPHSQHQQLTELGTHLTRQRHLLELVDSCLRNYPSYYDSSIFPDIDARRARPFPALPADCTANLSLSTHDAALVQLTQLIRRMRASEGELDYFDLLADRASDGDGPAIPYSPLPSSWLHAARWDDEAAAEGDSSSVRGGGECELLQLGEQHYAHKQHIYAVRDATAHINPDNRHRMNLTTTSLSANTTLLRCTPTYTQQGQAQDNITAATATTLPPGNSSYLPRPPVTYLISRHNSANAWHSLVEHIYPQWLQMLLRGDFPYAFDQLTAAFSRPAPSSSSAAAVTADSAHFDLFVYHETGSPTGPHFDGWWQTLLGAPVRYLRPGDAVSCQLCILGPPKALAVYDYWGGSRFVYDSATQFAVRLFRRHVHARVDVAPWRVGTDDAPPVRFSFQQAATQHWRVRGDADDTSARMEYVLPDFPRLLANERAARSKQSGKDVALSELSPSGFNFSALADRNRSILITGNASWQGWPADAAAAQHLTAVSSLPLVVLTRRHATDPRTLSPFSTFTSFYQQPHVLATLPYNLLLVYVEDLPLADQVALFSRASVLLTVEGASEINQLYLPLRSAVVEVECERRFYDGERPRPWHQSMGQYLGHLFVQWNVLDCAAWNEEKAQRLHELLVRVLESGERNKYVYMS